MLTKLSDRRHALEIVRADGTRERVELETRSYLQHDLMHYAVESAAGTSGGVFGQLHAGRTLAELSDRSERATPASAEMQVIEQIVGVMHHAASGHAPGAVVQRLREYATAIGGIAPELRGGAMSVGSPLPPWVTAEMIADVQRRMRELRGRWNATPYRGSLELAWPPG